MARSSRKFRQKYNESLDYLATGGEIESISGFAKSLSTSRTTARLILTRLTEVNLLVKQDGIAIRTVNSSDYFPLNDVMETREILRTACMKWIIKERLQPGTRLDEVEIATRLRIPVSSVHEFLLSLSQFGFFYRVRNREWVVEAMNKDFIAQILELRMIFELSSIDILIALPEDNVFWRTLHNIKKLHLNQINECTGETLPFFELDNRLHELMNSASNNRLMQIFQEAIFFIFFYHYHWESNSEKERNIKALKEHLLFIDALLSRDAEEAKLHLRMHLQSAQKYAFKLSG